MDELDRTWERFKDNYQNRFFRIFVLKHIDWSEKFENANGNVKCVIRISCKVVHYLLIASLAYYLTRDGGNYYAESDIFDFFNMLDPDVAPTFWYKIVWAIVVFLLCLVLFP